MGLEAGYLSGMEPDDTPPKDPQLAIPLSVEDKALLDRAAADERLPLASWARRILVLAAREKELANG